MTYQEALNPPRSQATSASPSASRERISWIDTAKGIGIVLVVIGHALGGLIDKADLVKPAWFRDLFLGMYVFHMPLFFMLSGLFVAGRIRSSKQKFGRSIVQNIVWPYLLWSVVQLTVIYAASAYVNAPIDSLMVGMISIPIDPPSQFWFLYALMLYHCLALAILPRVGGMFFFLIAIMLASVTLLNVLPRALSLAAPMIPFYALGVFLGQQNFAAAASSASRGMIAAVVSVAIVLVGFAVWNMEAQYAELIATTSAGGLANLAWSFGNFAIAIIACCAVCLASTSIWSPLNGVLQYLGRHSMTIFLLHVMVVAGMRIVMVNIAGIQDAVAIMLVASVAGIALPLIAFEIGRKLNLNRILGLT